MTIYKKNGDVLNFSDVTGYLNTGLVVSFKGKLQGSSTALNYEYNWSEIDHIERP